MVKENKDISRYKRKKKYTNKTYNNKNIYYPKEQYNYIKNINSFWNSFECVQNKIKFNEYYIKSNYFI